ncbi:enoyl-CoA hydratase [Pacificimonas flava]|uniref:Enoyl-CoA hydratase n=2 Tax=Pacificimonas TaxID=1960290 RepID=A0A219B2Y5_9SPHN|nr:MULTISPECIES: crotonase/enoyl-CoA hydratase family protein [Pacificimonas]MBZ6377854.1 crotonase/enoyl-CoA hydratase family protein [Pacificimonas aurantium]OWV32483.1 enoyl-CoA hydratase [Pacificimonas flava]
MSERVSLAVESGVADVRLARPDKMNAFDDAMFDAVNSAIDELSKMTALRCVVLSGEGRGFCAGLDLSNFGKMASGERKGGSGIVDTPRYANGANRAQQVSFGWRDLPVPVVAAVHGVALGAGFQLALGADLRFVAHSARLSAFEMNWGLVPDMGAFPLMKELMRADVVRDLVYTGRMVEGGEAVEIGLATRLCDDPRAEALEYARAIANSSPDAIRAAKRLLNLSAEAEHRDILEAESEEMSALIGSPNQIEAVNARMEKRAPVFSD